MTALLQPTPDGFLRAGDPHLVISGALHYFRVHPEQWRDRLRRLVGFAPDWTDLAQFLPEGWADDPARRRSATAATFAASLELARQGRLELRQEGSFAPISLRRPRP